MVKRIFEINFKKEGLIYWFVSNFNKRYFSKLNGCLMIYLYSWWSIIDWDL